MELVNETLWGSLGLAENAEHAPHVTINHQAYASFAADSQSTLVPRQVQASLPLEDLPPLPVWPSPEGEMVSDYQRMRVLGQGGMGVVHLAKQRSLGREVALKSLQPKATRQSAEPALIHEGRLTGYLEHPNIPPVHALCRSATGPTLVMKRIEGVTWNVLIHDAEHPAWELVANAEQAAAVRHCEIMLKVCDALGYAHANGVLHRDVKPENVMIGAFGEVYLLDWGIAARVAKLADQAEPAVVGTPHYIAPEMLDGEASELSDVYLLGATLHEVLTGKPRHPGKNLFQVMRVAYRSEPVVYDDTVPKELADLANAATHKDPRKRPQSIREMQAKLREYLAHRGAVRLAVQADTRLSEAERLIEGMDHGAADRLLVEARFGYQQALQIWPEYPRALLQIECVLTRLVEVALLRKNPEVAQQWAAECRQPDPVWAQRIAGQQGHQANLEGLAADLDPSVGQRQRVMFLLVLTVGMTAVAQVVGRTVDVGYSAALWISGNAAIFTLVGLVLARKTLFQNEYNRRISLFVFLASTAIFANRMIGSTLDVPVEHALVGDFMLMAAISGAAAISVASWVVVYSVLALGAAVTAALRPDWIGTLMVSVPIVATGITVVGLWVRTRKG